MDLDYIFLKHSIKSKDENGRILAEITFPEEEPGKYSIQDIYICDDLFGQGVEQELMQMAVKRIKEQGGSVEAEHPYGKKWLKENII